MKIKHFLLNFFGVKLCDKIAISAYILKIVEKDPFLRLQMSAKEMFNHHQFLKTGAGPRHIKSRYGAKQVIFYFFRPVQDRGRTGACKK